METKLTLKLDKDVIQSVKHYAEINHRSLSKLVEDYFRNLISNPSDMKEYSPLVLELSGVINESDIETLDYVNYLETKYE